jgi:hypothetical protein
MSKEEITVKQWPFDRAMEAINGSGFDTQTIRNLNQHGTEAQKRSFIHERRKDAIYSGLALTALLGAELAYSTVKNHGHPLGGYINGAIEQHSSAHNQIPGSGTLHTKSGGFHVTQKPEVLIGTAVAAEMQNGHVQEVDPVTLAEKK